MGTSPIGSVSVKTFGNRPNQRFVVAFNNMSIPAYANNANARFQLVLHESSGIIEFIYGNMIASVEAQGFGPPGIGRPPLNQFHLINPLTQQSFTSSTVNLVSIAQGNVEGLHSSNPSQCRRYVFTPPAVPNFDASSISFLDVVSGRANFLVDEAPLGQSHIIYFATAPEGPFISRGLVNDNALLGFPNSTYYIRAYRTNGAAVSTNFASGTLSFGSARKFVSAQSGPWYSADTWQAVSGNPLPVFGDTIIIGAGHTVNIVGQFVPEFFVKHLEVNGTLDFAAANRTVAAVDIVVNEGGQILAHNASAIANPNAAQGGTIVVYGSMTGEGLVDLRYGKSLLDLNALLEGYGNRTISVNFARNEQDIPMVPRLIVSLLNDSLSLQTDITVTREIIGFSGSIATNGRLTLNRNATQGNGSPQSSLIISRFDRRPLFIGTVNHLPNNQINLRYNNHLNRWPLEDIDYAPMPFVAGAELPQDGQLHTLFVYTDRGVVFNRPVTVNNQFTLAGNIRMGSHAIDVLTSNTENVFHRGLIESNAYVSRNMSTLGDWDITFPWNENRMIP